MRVGLSEELALAAELTTQDRKNLTESLLDIAGQKQGHSEFLSTAGSSINGESWNSP